MIASLNCFRSINNMNSTTNKQPYNYGQIIFIGKKKIKKYSRAIYVFLYSHPPSPFTRRLNWFRIHNVRLFCSNTTFMTSWVPCSTCQVFTGEHFHLASFYNIECACCICEMSACTRKLHAFCLP